MAMMSVSYTPLMPAPGEIISLHVSALDEALNRIPAVVKLELEVSEDRNRLQKINVELSSYWVASLLGRVELDT